MTKTKTKEKNNDATNFDAGRNNKDGKDRPVPSRSGLADSAERTDSVGSADSGSTPTMVRAESVGAIDQTDPTPRPKATRKRRSKAAIEAEHAETDRIAQAERAVQLEKLRENTSATVGVFIDGFNPLFKYIIPPELAPPEKTALVHVWTMYMIQDGVEIPAGKAAVALTAIIIVPRVILAIVDYVQKRRKEKAPDTT